MMRPPFGSANAAALAVVGSRKKLAVSWNLDSLDYSYAGTSDAAFLSSVQSNFYAGPTAGLIVLNHVGS